VPADPFGIRAAVLARTPVDEREASSIVAFVSAFDALADPCSEHADLVHVTASAVVVGERGVVLHLHKRLGLWLQPGGHIDVGESPWAAAWREGSEETGLPLEPVPDGAPALLHVDVHPGPRGHTHLDLRYLVRAAAAEPAPGEGESPDVRWFTWDDALAIADPGLVGVLRSLAPDVA
jgi:8-oxo-dGTP pyrophosphatase MutT (NUDIX family)